MSTPETDQDTFARAHEVGAAVLDVREPHEYEAGHVAGAVNVPLGQLPARSGEVAGGDTVYVVCQSGGRSAQGVQALLGAGVDAVSVVGGTKDWQAAGRPITVGPTP